MIKNQPVPALRRTTLLINQDDGVTPIARNSNLLSRLLLDKGDGNYVAAGGIFTNKRMPLTGANFTFTVTVGTDPQKVHAVANPTQVLDGPFRATTTGTFPTGMAGLTDYWVTPFGADDFKISTSYANALAAVYVTMSTNGTGVLTWNFQGTTQRGVDGDFQYEFTQAETNQTATSLWLLLPGLVGTNAPSRTCIALDGDSIGFDAVSEDGYTYGDVMRGIGALYFGKATGYDTNTPQWWSMDGTKARIQGTTDSTGRPSTTILDFTP